MQRACRYDQIEAAVCKGQAILVALHAADAAGEAKAGVGRDHAFHRQACAERAIGCAQIKRAAEPTVDGGKPCPKLFDHMIAELRARDRKSTRLNSSH